MDIATASYNPKIGPFHMKQDSYMDLSCIAEYSTA